MNSIVVAAAVPLLLFVGIQILNRKKYKVNKNGIILVTGASTGIGRHAVEYLAARHDYLVLAGVRKESDAESIRKLNIANLQPIIIDVSSHDSIARAVNEIKKISKERNLPFVGLVNNAGISRTVIAEFHKLEDARSVMETNFFGVMDLTQQTLPLLRASKGRIINISSLAGFLAIHKYGVYSASKFALEAFSDSLRRELSDHGVSVTVIQPGHVKTSIHHTGLHSSQEVVPAAEKEEMLSLYGRFLTQKKADLKEAQWQRSDGPIVVTTAIEDALISPFPVTRVAVAGSNGLPSTVIWWLNWFLPDRIVDKIFDK